ncbi:SDR family NAD(P)-dependent oxidoreductase, partial [Candidatus Pelagibacter sp.]|nr:SDR family NAD(P)-dependent oxidoreductase [Candidatus Pelagibacter sp.]
KNKFDSSTYWQLEKKLKRLNIKLIKFTNKNLSEESTTINFQNTKLKKFDKKLFKNKTILVTGAAGSIGKEICLQLQNTDAKKIIGIDLSEYLIAKFNQNNYLDNSKIEMILADVTNIKLLNDIFEKFKPSFIFHAAANKHVDLVENNYKYSINNNLTGVYNVLKISSKKNYIKKFVFISTDKAIESTNYMGASKMIGEILTNYFALKYNKNFSSVRFGNVIGSSGSFLEIIKDQISKGGPITITDKKASRYFMTISDAVNLVLHTISFSSQGGTYVLKMGDPINIFDLTKKILSLNNLKIKDATNPSGDIKIKIIGLKKGEKLHEKLYNKNSKITKTNNTLIDYECPNTIDKSIVKNILIFCESSEKNHTEKSIKELLSYFKS